MSIASWRRALVIISVLLAWVVLVPSPAQSAQSAAPTCAVLAPSTGQQIGGSTQVYAGATNAQSVYFQLNGDYLGRGYFGFGVYGYSPDGGNNFLWDTASEPNGTYSVTCVAVGNDGTSVTSAPVTFTISNGTGCTVQTFGSPLSGTKVAIGAQVPATATGANFYLHSSNQADVLIGAAAPSGFGWLYSPDGGTNWGWDSTQFPDGNYTLTCEAITPSGNVTSSALPVTLSNGAPIVNVFGRPASFGTLGNPAPSGESLVPNPVPSWVFPPGREAAVSNVAADGTVVMANYDQGNNGINQTAAAMTLSTFTPSTKTFQNVNVLTSTGKQSAIRSDGTPLGASVSDVQPLAGTNAVAFSSPVSYEGQDPADGAWPAFGILTKVNGKWQVASGNGWINQWTGHDLAASNSTPTGNPTYPTVGSTACPPDANNAGASFCQYPNDIAQFPQSHDIVVAQYFNSTPNSSPAGLMVLHVTGPNGQGRFTTSIKSVFAFPKSIAPDPSSSDSTSFVGLAPLSVQTDPTSTAGDERFVVMSDQYVHCSDEQVNANCGVQYLKDKNGNYVLDSNGNKIVIGPAYPREDPRVFTEYSYNSTNGTIHEVSAPTVTGDQAVESGPKYYFRGADSALYDHQGNLWIGQTGGSNGFAGGPIAVYAKSGGARKLGGAQCPFNPSTPLQDYSSTRNGITVWGATCKPDYEILQPQETLGYSLSEDATSRTIAAVSLGGTIFNVRSAGSGSAMTFTIGNPVDTGTGLLPQEGGRQVGGTAFDANGTLWSNSSQFYTPPEGQPLLPYQVLDQYLYGIATGRLFQPDTTTLPGSAGQTARIQAETTSTVSTTQRTPGAWATTDVDSNAYVRGCPANLNGSIPGSCTDDGVPGNGFYVTNSAGTGVQPGTTLTYPVSVPTAGTYQIAYQVQTSSTLHTAAIGATVGSASSTTPIDTGGAWQTVPGPTLTLAAGAQTLALTPPSGAGGWKLNWLTLTRR